MEKLVAKTNELGIRPMQAKDAEAVARLGEQLGYPTDPTTLKKRFLEIEKDKHSAIRVAELSGEVVGWVHIVAHATLLSNARSEIAGLVVDEKFRGLGIGSALMKDAENWTLERHLSSVLLRSQTKREEAHRFYQHLGYQITKTSYVLVKSLSPEAQDPQP